MREAPVRLRCEYLEDPLGIDTDRPRLSWWLNDPRPAELQTAYQIQAASSPDGLEKGATDLWDTGYVSSQQTVNVEYRGRRLSSGTRVWWRVRCYDSDGIASPWSAPGYFELGLLESGDWRARWIAAPLTGSPATAVPAPVLYRNFELQSAPASARLHLAVLGAVVVEINGRPVTDAEALEPWSDLRRRVPYRVLDVTRALRRGHNRLAAILGDGGYCGHLAGGPRQRYGQRPALCAQLMVELGHGHRRVIASDPSWRWYPSWILRADRDGGEELDARRFLPGWSRPDTSVDGYPVVEEHPGVLRYARRSAPAVVSTEREPPVAPQPGPGGRTGSALCVDFGRILFGRVRVEILAPANAVLTIRYGEPTPDATDTPTASSVRWSGSVDRYTARGSAPEVFEPRFAFHAFRWVEIAVDRDPFQVRTVRAMEVACGAPGTAAFQCDHAPLEALFRAADHTLHLGLSLGPVSALTVAERRADTDDGEAILAGALATRDAVGLFQDWLAELAALEDADGPLPRRLPALDADVGEGADFGSLLRCLWLVYRAYGDRRLLEQLFGSVRRTLAGMAERWPVLIRGGSDGACSPRQQMLATAWYCQALTVAARMAGVLGRSTDLEHNDALARRVTLAFRARFLTRDGLLVADDQLGYLLALELGLLEGAERETVLQRLQTQLAQADFDAAVELRHVGLLLEVLTREGRADLAYRVLLRSTPAVPPRGMGGDAGVLRDRSRDLTGRLAAASVAGWLQRFLLGLELDDDLTPDETAYRRARIQPRPPLGSAFAGVPVREASGHLDTMHGRYECGWRITGEAFTLSVRVPGNCGARVILPDGSEREVRAGVHEFSVALDQVAGAGVDYPGQTADDIPVLREISSGSTG